MVNKNFSFGDAFKAGWRVFREHWIFFVGSCVIIFLISGIFSGLSQETYKDIEPTSGILAFIGLFFRVWLNFNLLVITIRIFDGVKPEWSDLFVWREETIPYIGASILYVLITLLGVLFFIVPGIYFSVKYGFYGFLIADKKTGAFDALKASGQMTDGVKLLLIGFGFASTGVVVLGALAFGVGLLIALPVVSLALIAVYRSLYDQTFNHPVVPSGTVMATVSLSPISVDPVVVAAAEHKASEPMVTPAPEVPKHTPPTLVP